MNRLKHLAHCPGSCLLLVIAVFSPAVLTARTVIEAGNTTVWKYVDDGIEPDAAWRQADFDDARWKSGKAPLGYGDPGMGTEVGWGTKATEKFISTWFRRVFDKPELKPGERLVVACCIDDGSVIYLNGREIGRVNMPPGPVTATTTAVRALSDRDEGFYLRIPLPTNQLHPGENVLAVEVHQASSASSDLFFDLALKTVAADARAPAVLDAARSAVNAYRYEHYLGPSVTIPDGFEDGGRAMKFDAEGRPTSRREILVVDRTNDVELARHLAFARSPELRALPPLERAMRLAAYIDKETTPPGGASWEEQTTEQLEEEFANKPVFLGDWVDQGHAGMCRHRALLFKVLGDEAGLKTALVRGNFDDRDGAHTWNELFSSDGRRLLVDLMLKRDKQDFPEVTSPSVRQHYLKVDSTAWYEPADLGP